MFLLLSAKFGLAFCKNIQNFPFYEQLNQKKAIGSILPSIKKNKHMETFQTK